MNHTPLARWLSSYIGDDKLYKSAHALSEAAGYSGNVVNNIINRGVAAPDTVVALGRFLNVSPIRLLIMTGLLSEEDLEYEGLSHEAQLTTDETEIISQFRSLSEEVRPLGHVAVLGVIQGLLRHARKANESRQAAS